jgi:hypothetical protein
MKKLTEKKLISLGFKKITIKPIESGQKNTYHYFIYRLNKTDIFISNTNDERIDGSYFVEFYEQPEIGKFYKTKQIRKLIKILKFAKKE